MQFDNRILATQTVIRECDRVIDCAKAFGCDEYSDGVDDDESDVVDSLVGTAFIATQTQITAVVSSIERVHRRAQKDRLELKSSDGTKEGISGAGNPVVTPSGITRIQLINAFANYFKHRDEWPHPWSKVGKQHQKTVIAIEAAGAKARTSGNLRIGLDTLGIRFDELVFLRREVSDWAKAIIAIYRAELKTKGVL